MDVYFSSYRYRDKCKNINYLQSYFESKYIEAGQNISDIRIKGIS